MAGRRDEAEGRSRSRGHEPVRVHRARTPKGGATIGERWGRRTVYAPAQLTTEGPTWHKNSTKSKDPTSSIEGDLDELVDDDLIAEDALALPDEDDDADVVVVEDEDETADIPAVGAKVATKAGEESEEDDEEEPDDEDVEASLDTILKERLVVEEPEDDEDTPEPEDRSGDGVERVLPKQPGEFVCRSCFLVKHPNQLADRKKMLCRDCV